MYENKKYKELLEEYCKENPKDKTFICKDSVWSEGFFTYDAEEMKEFLCDRVLAGCRKLNYLQDTRNALKGFYDWCVEKGEISFNPWKSIEYEYCFFANYMTDRLDIKFYT